MDNRFDRFFEILMENEGVNYTTPDYDGHHTKFGITQKFLNGLGYDIQVKKLNLKAAKLIYFNEFWEKLKCNKILSDKIAFSLCDYAVNVGHKRAVRTLQRSANSISSHFYLKDDGIIGKNTLNALNTIVEPYNLSITYARDKIKQYTYLNTKRYESKLETLENGIITINEFEQYVRKWQNIHDGWVNRSIKMI